MEESQRERQSQDPLNRALLSLEGLSLGDAFGGCYYLPLPELTWKIEDRILAEAPWLVTDDTIMAISIVESLRRHGRIVEDWLADHFAAMYDLDRSYGAGMCSLLARIRLRGGRFWQEEATSLFNGRGSYGNGAAMRVAPLGAFFADDLNRLVEQAKRSAVTTHFHPEAVSGAIAIALGTAHAWRTRLATRPSLEEFLEFVRLKTPESKVRIGIENALRLRRESTVYQAAAALGNGGNTTAMDTVPFVLWCGGRWIDDYEEAMWQTVSAGGDKDTTCAMVGGIVAMRVGLEGLPRHWLMKREPLSPLFSRIAHDQTR
jgi:ADP-ribosylglycohydrolase